MKNLVLISQLAIHVLVPTFVCLMAGLWLDQRFGTGCLSLIGLGLGILAGGRNAYLMALNSVSSKKEEDPQAIVDRVNKKE